MFNPVRETFTNINRNKRDKQRVLFVIQILKKDVAENIVTTLYKHILSKWKLPNNNLCRSVMDSYCSKNSNSWKMLFINEVTYISS